MDSNAHIKLEKGQIQVPLHMTSELDSIPKSGPSPLELTHLDPKASHP